MAMDNFLKQGIKTLLIIPVLFMAGSVYSGEGSVLSMTEHKNIKGAYTYKKTSQMRATFSFTIEKFSQGEKTFCKLTEKGKGDYDKYENVTWESKAEAEEGEDLLRIIYSDQTVKDKDGNTIVEYKKRLDYDKGKIYYSASDGKGNIIREETFSVKGRTVDNLTMMYFLKRFLAHPGQRAYRSFYLITNEPRFYRIDIKVTGTEELELPIGRIEAVKLRLIPDMGLFTALAGAFIPPTYAWYTEGPPYNWLQYEGLETGLGSAHIVARISSAD